eukprot:753512-Hanusia_phi.AAC.1
MTQTVRSEPHCRGQAAATCRCRSLALLATSALEHEERLCPARGRSPGGLCRRAAASDHGPGPPPAAGTEIGPY